MAKTNMGTPLVYAVVVLVVFVNRIGVCLSQIPPGLVYNASHLGISEYENAMVIRDYYADHDAHDIPYSCRWAMGVLKHQSHVELEYEALKEIATCKAILTTHSVDYPDIYHLQNNHDIQKQWKAVFPSCHDTACVLYCNDPHNTFYRTADGSCNNKNHRTWGRADSPHQRLLPPDYGDYYNLGYLPRKGKHYALPSVRDVSNILFSGSMKFGFDTKLSLEMMSWGQFLDHDVTLTPTSKGHDGGNIECCSYDAHYHRLNDKQLLKQITLALSEECFPIEVSDKTDPYFHGDRSTNCMNFVRSAPAVHTDGSCKPHWREQLNEQTSFIDGSMIYGKSYEEQYDLRKKEFGKMDVVNDNYLPHGDDKLCKLKTSPPNGYCTKTGDERSNEIPHLNLHHTMFVRQHNSIAERLYYCYNTWDDEKIYQETRKIVIAIIQKITYHDFLPKLLGPYIMEHYGLRVGHDKDNYYDPEINPTTFNAFGTAAYRVGHTLIPDVTSLNTNYDPSKVVFDIQDFADIPLSLTFFDPFFATVQQNNHSLLHMEARALVTDKVGFSDGIFSSEVRNLLFVDDALKSFDLAALNMQRGRDHGLPGYNEWRKFCGLKEAVNFNDLSDHTWQDQFLLSKAYHHVDDIDLYAGGVTEKLLPGARVGPTFGCILGIQFHALKHGDSFWFERYLPDEYSSHLTKDQINAVKDVTLAKVFCENFHMDYIQEDVFRLPIHELITSCSSLADIDLSAWGCYYY